MGSVVEKIGPVWIEPGRSGCRYIFLPQEAPHAGEHLLPVPDGKTPPLAPPAGRPLYLVSPIPTAGSRYFATLGDINIGEPGALIGFAGPRVIQQTIGQTLPAGFQKAEFLLEHGLLDMVVERKEMKATLARLLRFHQGGEG